MLGSLKIASTVYHRCSVLCCCRLTFAEVAVAGSSVMASQAKDCTPAVTGDSSLGGRPDQDASGTSSLLSYAARAARGKPYLLKSSATLNSAHSRI